MIMAARRQNHNPHIEQYAKQVVHVGIGSNGGNSLIIRLLHSAFTIATKTS
jgi:hypothetical protein